MLTKKTRITVLLLVGLAAVMYWLWQDYSPYQICLRHAQAEGVKSGMSAEGALGYAEGLCTSKLPLKR